MPDVAGGLTSGEQLGPTREKLESQAWAPAGQREASARILLRPAARLDDAVERDVIKGNDLSQGDSSFCVW